MTRDWREIAEEIDALKDTGREFDGLVRVNARVSKNPRDVVSVRMRPDELSEITDAAKAVDQNVSEFIRESALKQARAVSNGFDQVRKALADYIPTRYRPDMTDDEVRKLLSEVQSALFEATSIPFSGHTGEKRSA